MIHYNSITKPSLCLSFFLHRNPHLIFIFPSLLLLVFASCLMMSTTPPLELDYIGSSKCKTHETYSCLKTELSLSLPGSDESNHPVLELSLFDQQTQPPTPNGYSVISVKRGFADTTGKWGLSVSDGSECKLKDMDIDALLETKPAGTATTAKAQQVVGWPPIGSFRKNSVSATAASTKNDNEADGKSGFSCLYVKVSMDGAPYLRKVDLKLYNNYKELSLALKKMFSSFPLGKDGASDSHPREAPQGSECVLTYEDKDGDWMLVGDVPWDMFTSTCKRLRIMKGSEAIRLAPRGEGK